MSKKSKISKAASALLSAVIAGIFGLTAYYDSRIPDSFYVESGKELEICGFPAIKESTPFTAYAREITPSAKEVSLSLFGVIPIKNVEVQQKEAPTVIAGGEPFGIKLLMDGVMVVRLDGVEIDGKKRCPAADCGIREGDIIRCIGGKSVSSNKDIQKIINESGGEKLEVTFIRENRERTVVLESVYSKSREGYFAGMWVRDSTAGIGTITFIDKETGGFAGLGHPVCDSDTGEIVPVSSGEAVPVEITDVVKGKAGSPGELQGRFISSEASGELVLNNKCGVFGHIEADMIESEGREYKLGFKQEIKCGKASVLTTIDGTEPKMYDIEIKSIESQSSDSSKNMIIKITDEELLNSTGGIVQGMSGSPIIQGNRLIGAVTHVFVDDSSCGYAIFAENMLAYLR